jgi:hypothetical protein
MDDATLQRHIFGTATRHQMPTQTACVRFGVTFGKSEPRVGVGYPILSGPPVLYHPYLPANPIRAELASRVHRRRARSSLPTLCWRGTDSNRRSRSGDTSFAKG